MRNCASCISTHSRTNKQCINKQTLKQVHKQTETNKSHKQAKKYIHKQKQANKQTEANHTRKQKYIHKQKQTNKQTETNTNQTSKQRNTNKIRHKTNQHTHMSVFVSLHIHLPARILNSLSHPQLVINETGFVRVAPSVGDLRGCQGEWKP